MSKFASLDKELKMSTIDAYIEAIPEERRVAFQKLRSVVNDHIPAGFNEDLSYGMPAFVVPHSTYPDGYHCKPEEPLPFLSLGNSKGHIGFYHMGIYSKPELMEWLKKRYAEEVPTKLDMGKSCIRFKKMDQIPYDLIGELMEKMTVGEWIDLYEQNYKR